MTEEWARWVLAGILAWGVWELRQLRAEVASRVHYRDCDKRMSIHEEGITRLEDEMNRNRERIAALEAKEEN